MQKYPHITETYACILKIFSIMFLLLLTNFSLLWRYALFQKNEISDSFAIYI